MPHDAISTLESSAKLRAGSKFAKLIRIPGKLVVSGMISRSAGKIVRKNVKTFWGGRMAVVLPEVASMTIYRYGFLEYDLSRAFVDYLKPGMTFFDVGAHFGYFSCLAAHLVGPAGRVHAFEPTRSTFEILGENAASRPNIVTNNVAAFSTNGSIAFNDFGVAFSAYNSPAGARLPEADRAKLAPTVYDVNAITLDDYVRETGARPNAIKIDAESAEMDILRGMDRVLREIRPAVSIEVGDFQIEGVAASAEVVGHLVSHGYRPHEWRDGALRPHQPRANYKFGNLLFLPQN